MKSFVGCLFHLQVEASASVLVLRTFSCGADIFREDIMNFARVFTGFDEQGARGNIEHVEGKAAPACAQLFIRVITRVSINASV